MVFASWLIINPFYLSKAVDSMEQDESLGATSDVASRNGHASAEISQLRADVDRLLAGARR